MDNIQTSGHPLVGIAYTVISIILGFVATLVENMELIVRLLVGVVSLCAGGMAIRYHYFATKEKIISIKNQKSSS